jgi:hypothetical protein
MREELRKLNGQRMTFRACFERFGSKKAYRGPDKITALFCDVQTSADETVTDHLWMIVGKRLDALQLQPGDRVEFDARVSKYRKGYWGRCEDLDLPPPTIDYRLSFPSKVKKLPAEPDHQRTLLTIMEEARQ